MGQLQDALDRQTKLLEDVGAEMSSFEEGRAADLMRARERFLELEAALQAAEQEVSPALPTHGSPAATTCAGFHLAIAVFGSCMPHTLSAPCGALLTQLPSPFPPPDH